MCSPVALRRLGIEVPVSTTKSVYWEMCLSNHSVKFGRVSATKRSARRLRAIVRLGTVHSVGRIGAIRKM